MNDEIVRDRQEAVAPAKASINRDAPLTRLIAGVNVSDSPLITAVIEYAQRLSEPYLFNHAMRSWLFAETIGRIKGIDYDHEVVAIGTILHDIGLTAGVSGPNRFEVNGADAALSFITGRVSRIAVHNWSGTWLRSTRRHRSRFTRSRRWRWARWASDSTTAASALTRFRQAMSIASSALFPA